MADYFAMGLKDLFFKDWTSEDFNRLGDGIKAVLTQWDAAVKHWAKQFEGVDWDNVMRNFNAINDYRLGSELINGVSPSADLPQRRQRIGFMPD